MSQNHVPYLIWGVLAVIAVGMGILTQDLMLVGLLSLPVLGWYVLVIRNVGKEKE